MTMAAWVYAGLSFTANTAAVSGGSTCVPLTVHPLLRAALTTGSLSSQGGLIL